MDSSNNAAMDESKLPPKNPTPEQNLLGRVRNWTDVFPWLRLVKACRIIGGPIWMTHGTLVVIAWQFGLGMLGTCLYSYSVDPFQLTINTSWFTSVPAMMWTVVWVLPHLMAFGRVGALLTAGREIPSYLGTWKLVGRRIGAGLLIFVLPAVCCLPFVAIMWAAAKVSFTLGSPQSIMRWVSMIFIVPSAVVAGLLLIGGKAAVPLALISLMTVETPDPMDSISRGYEYTLRRFPQLVGYTLIAILLALPSLVGWSLIAYAAWWVAVSIGVATDVFACCLASLVITAVAMLGAAMIGGVYLLMRQSASGQEVDDIWAETEGWIAPELPSVQQSNEPTSA